MQRKRKKYRTGWTVASPNCQATSPPSNKQTKTKKERKKQFRRFSIDSLSHKKKNEQNNSLNCAIMHQIFVIPLLIFFQSNSQECATFVHSSRARTLKKKKLSYHLKQSSQLGSKIYRDVLKNHERRKKKKKKRIDRQTTQSTHVDNNYYL